LPPQIPRNYFAAAAGQKKKESRWRIQLALGAAGLSGFEQSVFKLLSADNLRTLICWLTKSRLTISDLDRGAANSGDA